MKNDLTCGVVRDLLPSYADGIAGEETAAAVERHMAECEECRAALHRMKEPEDAAPPEEKEIDYLKKVRSRRRRRVTTVLPAAALQAGRDRSGRHGERRHGSSDRHAHRQRTGSEPDAYHTG